MAVAAASKDKKEHASLLTFAREEHLSPPQEEGAPPHLHRHLDSHSLFWDDLNKGKFLGLITVFYLGLRLCIYPTTLVSRSTPQRGIASPASAAHLRGRLRYIAS